MMASGQQYIDQLKQKLSNWDEQIDNLQQAAQNADAAAQAEYNKQIAAIKEQRAELGSKLDEIQSASGERWDEILGSIQDTVKSLEEKIAKVFK